MAVNKNLPIGATFEYDGVLLEVVNDNDNDCCLSSCFVCYFNGKDCSKSMERNLRPLCKSYSRLDDLGVFFKKVEPKSKEVESKQQSEGATQEEYVEPKVDPNLAIGETFECEGVLLVVIKETGCDNCHFEIRSYDCNTIKRDFKRPCCLYDERLDENDVKFKKVESNQSPEEKSIEPQVNPNLAIGETFMYDGKLLKVVKRTSCRECHFNNDGCTLTHTYASVPSCFAEYRTDKEKVAFVKIDLDKEGHIKPKVDPYLDDEKTFELDGEVLEVVRYVCEKDCSVCHLNGRDCASLLKQGLIPKCKKRDENDRTYVAFRKVEPKPEEVEYETTQEPTSTYPTEELIDALVEKFSVNTPSRISEALKFGYQEGLYKMLEIWQGGC